MIDPSASIRLTCRVNATSSTTRPRSSIARSFAVTSPPAFVAVMRAHRSPSAIHPGSLVYTSVRDNADDSSRRYPPIDDGSHWKWTEGVLRGKATPSVGYAHRPVTGTGSASNVDG